jgi:lysine 6-dehydrogenase
MKKIAILGGGLVGGPMAFDLAQDHNIAVTVFDYSKKVLEKFSGSKVTAKALDASDHRALHTAIEPFDLIVSAVPGFMGYATLKAIIEANKNAVDIAFFPEDALSLDALAKEHGVSAVVDCGVAPGMSNLLLGAAAAELDETTEAVVYVGGLPVQRQWPWEYKAVFSPVDVIEEYTRPARVVEHGQIVVKEALTDREYLDFAGIGTLEAFVSDGLRSVMHTLDIPNMAEKTLRYPGHADKIQILKASGLLDETPIEVAGKMVRPLDVTARQLFKQWQFGPDDRDLTVMRIIVQGRKSGAEKTLQYDLYDTFDEASGVHSMARVTGYTATVMARYMLTHGLAQKGILPPELLGDKATIVKYMLSGLKERGIEYRRSEK